VSRFSLTAGLLRHSLIFGKGGSLAVIVIRKTSTRSNLQVAMPRAVATPGERPEVLFVCRSGFEAEALIALLKSAGCLVTHAQRKIEARQSLAGRSFEAMIVDCSVSGSYELQAQAELRGIPVLVIARQRNETTGTRIAADSVEKLLEALCAISPLAATKARKQAIAS